MEKITDSILYIGVSDKDIDLFEGQYKVPKGISYNSYIIEDEKTVLMDTVDHRKSLEWLDELRKALGDRKIDYLVISHLEPDHSANIKKITELYPEITLIGSEKTFSMLPQFFDINPNIKKHAVKEGETLQIGKHILQFFMAPMVHWPEVMVTYEKTEKILFTADGFGTFDCFNGTTNIEENGSELWVDEARRYYINIVGKYGMQVQMLLKKAGTLDIKTICPLHGPILKENLSYYIGKYDKWSKYEQEKQGILVAVASIHGNTMKAAKKIVELIKEQGENNVKIMDLAREDMHEAVAQAFKYSKLILAASSYNMGVFTPMEIFLNTLKNKNYQNRKIGIIENGSWAPSAGKTMQAILSEMKTIELVNPQVTIKTTLTEENKQQLEQLAINIYKT